VNPTKKVNQNNFSEDSISKKKVESEPNTDYNPNGRYKVLSNLSNKFMQEKNEEPKDSFAYTEGINEFDEEEENFSQFKVSIYQNDYISRDGSMSTIVK
jgi:hypothetical protein